MESMVERVAKALAADTMKRWRSPVFMKDEPWREFIPAARAAIEVMREPTEEMIEAGGEANYGWTRAESVERAKEAVFEEHASNAKVLYQAYIDAALKETP